MASAGSRGRGPGRGAHPGGPGPDLRLHDRVRGSRRASPLRRAVSPAAGGLGAQLVLDVGTGQRLGREGARGRRAPAAAPVLRELPSAGRLQPPGPGAERLERHLDRRLHRPEGRLERAVAAPEALRLGAASREASRGQKRWHHLAVVVYSFSPVNQPSTLPVLADLRRMLPELMLHDASRLGRRIDRAAGLRDQAARERAIAELAADVAKAAQRVTKRRAALPDISYPEELPVSQRKDEIAAAIRDHQVVIVAGETGSGKTTQLPKICLELGRGITGQIGHTQPRRIAARTVAERIAEELRTELGQVVGYKVRFTDKSGDNTLVKLMTDGILLNEIASDADLLRYDTLIIDEAHERSLNIDFILGYLRQLLPRRPDLKVIITSATIDPQRFSRHFAVTPRAGTTAPAGSNPVPPVLEVSGRTYPVEVRYRPLDDQDQVQAITEAVAELGR